MVNKGTIDAVFQALASRPRRAIVASLSGGERTAGELAEPLSMSLPAVSKHLRVLEDSGLIQRRVDGRVHRITLKTQALDAAAGWLRSHGARWSDALDALEARLDADREDQR